MKNWYRSERGSTVAKILQKYRNIGDFERPKGNQKIDYIPVYYDKRLADICLNCRRETPCAEHCECNEYIDMRHSIYHEYVNVQKPSGFVQMAIERKRMKEGENNVS